MKTGMRKSRRIEVHQLVILCVAVLTVSLLTALAQAQTSPPSQGRGFSPTGSYAISDIENINISTGNLSLLIPVGALPKGRSNLAAQTSLFYNSKLYESITFVGSDPRGEPASYDDLLTSPDGGWRLTTGYQLVVRPLNQGTSPPCPEALYTAKVLIIFPDGSEHELRPYGYNPWTEDGYYDMLPDGYRLGLCFNTTPNGQYITTTPMTYYSIDGSYLRLTVQHDPSDTIGAPYANWADNPWTLYLPDGGRVTFNEPGAAGQRIYDSNNNFIEIRNITLANGNPATQIVDQFDRKIEIEKTNPTLIRYQGTGGQTLTWTAYWQYITPGSYKRLYSTGEFDFQTIPEQYVVYQLSPPNQLGISPYTFTYTSDALFNGQGELRTITLPSGAQATYSWTISLNNTASNFLFNEVTAKDLTYNREYDGITSPTTESWTYAWEHTGGGGPSAKIITAPDGGVARHWVEHFPFGPNRFKDMLAYKVENADGSVLEQTWQANTPYNSPIPISPISSPPLKANPYVKTEYRSVRDSSGTLSKTAIKDYSYDKNGNVTQVAEYDWVAYSSIPRDANGKPTGIPGGLTPKRVTVNTYYNATPDASNTTTDDPDVYHKATSPNIKRAIESSETRSDFSAGSAISRTESFYDDPSTTGNLTIERKWDSTKAGISRPLTAGNSISVTHQYDPYGNLTQTTDANGVQTQFIYDPINGHENLYVTQTKVAPGAAVQRLTTQAYDFHSGLVTQSTDVDNNVTTKMTYDVFGRPILVEEADGIAGVEKQTATEYSDTERRVIVRSDLNTTGDDKLITIQHYDQLGRVCLTRRLESGDPAEATDKTKGVKIQTRYFAGDAGNPNGYELVSAPYRAATSGAASGEPGMAWKRTKFDKGGRVIEVETLIGATPPAPWGGNSVSSGKFTTEYDAEFTTVTDQAGKKRRSRVDGLGRLVRVDEPDAVGNLGGTAAPFQPTDYAYNALDNLIQTTQTGVPSGGSTPVTQTRTFTFSSLGRLTSANNPESGLISYVYDANGNLTRKTDARGIFIDYTYDELNRNKTVDYSDTTAVNPDITREYDNPATGEYGKGRLWRSYAGGSESAGPNVEKQEVTGYDALGRAKSVQQSFKNNGAWSGAFTTSQTYDLAGHVKAKTYPSGRSVTYTYDVSGDLTDFTGNLGDGAPRTYSTGIQYNPQGQLIREQFGTSTPLYHRRHYNSRGQLFDVRLGTDGGAVNDGPDPAQWTGASWNRGALRMFFSSNLIEYAWPAVAPQADNGNLYRQDHFVPTALDGDGNVTGWVMSADYYCYDSLNRVAQTAEETYTSAGGYTPNVFNQRFSYDRFGNRLVSSAFGTGVPSPGFKINGANNRLIAPTDADGSQALDKMQYDASGNLIKDTHTQTGTTGNRFYDAENRMVTADGANGLANKYTYDADGHRTRRSRNNDGEIWWQVFGVVGELVAEYQVVSGMPTLKKEYGYRNGQLLVIAETTGTCQWLVTDALGTPRMIADQTGSLAGMKRRDYLPFGEEILAGVGHRQPTNGYSLSQSQQPRQQFTGKERDSETGLDYFDARYYGSLYGRFTSPDEFTGGPDELYDFADNAGDNPLLYAEKGEPQSLNKYQYCYNNPLVHTDIDGHKPWDWVKVGLEIASYVPGPVGTVASLAQAGIAIAEGDYKGALIAAAGAIPGEKLLKGVAKAVDKIADVAKVVDKLKDVAKFADKVDDTASTARTIGKSGASSIANLRKSVKREATYINTHASGKEYIGVGNFDESQRQARKIAKRYNDPHEKTKSITAANRREAFKEESRQIDARGGIMGGRNPKIYNQKESPGKQYRREDGEIP